MGAAIVAAAARVSASLGYAGEALRKRG
jgi:hypothetical protein